MASGLDATGRARGLRRAHIPRGPARSRRPSPRFKGLFLLALTVTGADQVGAVGRITPVTASAQIFYKTIQSRWLVARSVIGLYIIIDFLA